MSENKLFRKLQDWSKRALRLSDSLMVDNAQIPVSDVVAASQTNTSKSFGTMGIPIEGEFYHDDQGRPTQVYEVSGVHSYVVQATGVSEADGKRQCSVSSFTPKTYIPNEILKSNGSVSWTNPKFPDSTTQNKLDEVFDVCVRDYDGERRIAFIFKLEFLPKVGEVLEYPVELSYSVRYTLKESPIDTMAALFDRFEEKTRHTLDDPSGCGFVMVMSVPSLGNQLHAADGSLLYVCDTEQDQATVHVGKVIAINPHDGETNPARASIENNGTFTIPDGRGFIADGSTLRIVDNVIVEIIPPNL